jgi:SRSO17 transposase
VIDPTCFEKKGDHSVGVARQWNGRIGKEDNCQKAVLIAYAAPRGFAIVDERLYLPESWANDVERRAECYVPRSVAFKTSWELALDLVDDAAASLPHAWVVGDEEFGRPAEFRAGLRERNERYVLDVPSNTKVRPIRQSPPPKRHRLGRPPAPREFRASDWARARKSGAWVRILAREGTKGPHYVYATCAEVETRLDHSFGPRERLVVIRMPGASPEYKYLLTNAESSVSIGAIVGAALARHSIEEAIQRAKGEAGLAQYEIRSWVGWHHHMTFALLACWFLILERNRLGGENPEHDGAADGAGDRGAAA